MQVKYHLLVFVLYYLYRGFMVGGMFSGRKIGKIRTIDRENRG